MKFDPTLPADGVNVTPTSPLWELTLLLGGSVAVLGTDGESLAPINQRVTDAVEWSI